MPKALGEASESSLPPGPGHQGGAVKVIDSIWFTNGTGLGVGACVGIIIIEDDSGKRKAYVGIGNGVDEKADADRIVAWGTKFYLKTAQRIQQGLKNAT